MIHPSHPSHPLTLFPYPTYPSNSFYCNHCSLVGTGFSYGCSHCEFDLHVHCTHLPPNNMLEPPSSVPNEMPGVYPPPIPITNTHVPNPNKPMKTQGKNHFSHPHPLHVTKVDETDYISCSACEKNISGSCYSCKRRHKCDFHLHEECFELKQQTHHPSHPDHLLTLLSSHPYKEGGVFSCNACLEYGSTGFVYHCSICEFDLHVTCALLPEAVERKGDDHALILTYTSPITDQMRGENPDITLSCDVCKFDIDDACWIYRCEQCGYHTHLSCVNDEEADEEVDEEVEEEDDEETDEEGDEEVDVDNTNSSLKLSDQMQRLQFQMQMAKQQAQMMISCGQSLANLAG